LLEELNVLYTGKDVDISKIDKAIDNLNTFINKTKTKASISALPMEQEKSVPPPELHH